MCCSVWFSYESSFAFLPPSNNYHQRQVCCPVFCRNPAGRPTLLKRRAKPAFGATIINNNGLSTDIVPASLVKHYGPITRLCKRKKNAAKGQRESNRSSASSFNWFIDCYYFSLFLFAGLAVSDFGHFVSWKGHLVAFPCFDGTVKPGLGQLANLAATVIIVDILAK